MTPVSASSHSISCDDTKYSGSRLKDQHCMVLRCNSHSGSVCTDLGIRGSGMNQILHNLGLSVYRKSSSTLSSKISKALNP